MKDKLKTGRNEKDAEDKERAEAANTGESVEMERVNMEEQGTVPFERDPYDDREQQQDRSPQ